MIFEDGYLKSKCINHNYRGLVGFKCKIVKGVYPNQTGDRLVMVCRGSIQTEFGNRGRIGNVVIPQFTPKDIPVGELCWLKEYRKAFWSLVVFEDGIGNYHIHDKIVPYLIAETAERAEELKDWHK